MAKKQILNDKIVLLTPKLTNDIINYPILLLNNNSFDIDNIKLAVVDEKYKIIVFLTKGNLDQTDEDFYYFPINREIIIELKNIEEQNIIINNGYLDNFTEVDNILIKYKIENEG